MVAVKELLANIIANPDDDAPRLVYADALESAGDPRGEFIAVQCELARIGWDAERLFLDWIGDERVDIDALDDGRFARLRRREAELLRAHGKTWWKEASVPNFSLSAFRRGFIEHLAINANQNLDELFEAAPLLRSIWTSATQRKTLDAFFGSERLRKIRELSPNPIAVPWLIASKNLSGLRDLTLQHMGGPHVLPTLASAPFFSDLEVVTLYGFSLDAGAVTTLFRGGLHLRELQIVDSRMGREAAAALFASGALEHVRVLALRHARLAAGEVGPLFANAAERWRALEALDLRSNKLVASDTAAIAELPTIRVLDLGNNPTLGAPGIEALVHRERKGLGQLRSLALQKTGLDDTALKALARSPLISRLRVLDLRGNAITDAGARALVRDGSTKELRTLYLGGNKLGPPGKKALKAALSDTRLFL